MTSVDPWQRCLHWWERRTAGHRYVDARGQCKRVTRDPSGYCWQHSVGEPQR